MVANATAAEMKPGTHTALTGAPPPAIVAVIRPPLASRNSGFVNTKVMAPKPMMKVSR
jgi:hypothetical protein